MNILNRKIKQKINKFNKKIKLLCVIVITPSLNKSFKFQSDWPYNNSQAYLLTSIIDDLENDENRVVEQKDNNYILTSTVNYPNNKKLVKQLVTLDKDYNIKETQVMDENNNMQIKMSFSKIDLNAKFDDNTFDINNFVTQQDSSEDNTDINNDNESNEAKDDNNESESKENNDEVKEDSPTASTDAVIYPMYLPNNTFLKSQQKINKDQGERLILTFDGDSPFILIEETVDKTEEHVVIPTFGDLTQLSDTIGVVNDNSVNWYSSGIEYYVFSDKMDTSELLEVARSISVIPVSK